MRKLLLSAAIGASLWLSPSSFGMNPQDVQIWEWKDKRGASLRFSSVSFGMKPQDVQAWKLTNQQEEIAPELLNAFGLPNDTKVIVFNTNNLITADNLLDKDILNGNIKLESEFQRMKFRRRNPSIDKEIKQLQQQKTELLEMKDDIYFHGLQEKNQSFLTRQINCFKELKSVCIVYL